MLLHYLQAIFGLTILNSIVLIFFLFKGLNKKLIYFVLMVNTVIFLDFIFYYKNTHLPMTKQIIYENPVIY